MVRLTATHPRSLTFLVDDRLDRSVTSPPQHLIIILRAPGYVLVHGKDNMEARLGSPRRRRLHKICYSWRLPDHACIYPMGDHN